MLYIEGPTVGHMIHFNFKAIHKEVLYQATVVHESQFGIHT